MHLLKKVCNVKQEPIESPLYIILPYFNYCNYEKRLTLFVDFVKRYWNERYLKFVVVEGSPRGKPFQLPSFANNVILHIKVELADQVWIKENLINIGVRYLPNDWKYMGWIDADLTFLNKDWVIDTIRLLKETDVVQLFHTAINMGPDGEAMKIDHSFAYMSLKSGKPYHRAAKYGFWHPGFAWAIRRETYKQWGGLIDFAILGSGDRHMALSLVGKAEYSYHGGVHENYKKKVLEFQEKCKGLTHNYTPGTILHHFHGSLKDRQYVDRWLILVNHKYDPQNDIFYEKSGVLKLSITGKRMQKDILNYFEGRKEDGTVA